MKKLEHAPAIPGAGEPANLIPNGGGDGIDACPCCGAAWKGGKPWSDRTITPSQLAREMGVSTQAVTYRIRSGSIAAYSRPQRGTRNAYLIPIFEAERVLGGKPLAAEVEDLGEAHHE